MAVNGYMCLFMVLTKQLPLKVCPKVYVHLKAVFYGTRMNQ